MIFHCSPPRTHSLGGDSQGRRTILVNSIFAIVYGWPIGWRPGTTLAGQPVSSKEIKRMWSNRFAFAALATACIVAAGVGGYLATRSNATPAASRAAAAAAPIAGSPAAIKPVQETEAVVGDGGDRDGKGDSTPKITSAPTTS